jgi:hypothetical protein
MSRNAGKTEETTMDSKRRDGDGETLAAPRRVAAVAAIGMAALGMAGRVEAGNGEAIRLRDAAQSEYVLFHYTEAEAGFSAALRAAERARDRTETLASLRGLADVQFVLGRDAEAERAYLRVLDLESRRGPAEDPRRNAVLWAGRPSSWTAPTSAASRC